MGTGIDDHLWWCSSHMESLVLLMGLDLGYCLNQGRRSMAATSLQRQCLHSWNQLLIKNLNILKPIFLSYLLSVLVPFCFPYFGTLEHQAFPRKW